MKTFERKAQRLETVCFPIFSTSVDVDIYLIRENGCFCAVFGHLGYVNLHEELRK